MSCLDKFHILEIENLSVVFHQYAKRTKKQELPVISNLNVSVHEGEIVAVVGSSGSGKSLLAHAILGLLPSNAEVKGRFDFLEEPLTEERMKAVRGNEIALVPQSVNYLDPLMKVGKQVQGTERSKHVLKRQRELFLSYGLQEETEDLYPFECSGGMSRRILLSTALMGNTRLLIADEPTTALDVTIQASILKLLKELQETLGITVLFIANNMSLVSAFCDRIGILHEGRIIEEGETERIIHAPEQAYTRMLVEAARLHTAPAAEAETGEELLRVEHLKKYFDVKKKNKKLSLKAVDDVSFTLNKGEVLGIVGESGCGKSTLVNTILNLYDPTAGKVYFDGKDVFSDERKNRNAFKKNVQIVFQDPYWSLNPRWLVKEIVAEPLDAYEKLRGQERLARVGQLLEMVGLSRDDAYKYPHEFSGGERQRIAIARSLASNPKLVVLDEPTSSIDVFSQAQILELLRELKEKFQLTNILISHDLGVVSQMANKIAVMYLGKIAEFGPAAEVFRNPQHPYTKALFNAIPKFEKLGMDQLTTLEGAIPSPINPPSGCAFHTRCAEACEACKSWTPEPVYLNEAHYVSCIHFTERQGENTCGKR